MQWVVAIFRIEGDFQVIIFAVMCAGNLPDLMAEVAFDFQDQTANPLCRLMRSVCDHLLCKWPHTTACLSRSDGAEDADAGKQSFLRNRQPLGVAAGSDFRRMMKFANY